MPRFVETALTPLALTIALMMAMLGTIGCGDTPTTGPVPVGPEPTEQVDWTARPGYACDDEDACDEGAFCNAWGRCVAPEGAENGSLGAPCGSERRCDGGLTCIWGICAEAPPCINIHVLDGRQVGDGGVATVELERCDGRPLPVQDVDLSYHVGAEPVAPEQTALVTFAELVEHGEARERVAVLLVPREDSVLVSNTSVALVEHAVAMLAEDTTREIAIYVAGTTSEYAVVEFTTDRQVLDRGARALARESSSGAMLDTAFSAAVTDLVAPVEQEVVHRSLVVISERSPYEDAEFLAVFTHVARSDVETSASRVYVVSTADTDDRAQLGVLSDDPLHVVYAPEDPLEAIEQVVETIDGYRDAAFRLSLCAPSTGALTMTVDLEDAEATAALANVETLSDAPVCEPLALVRPCASIQCGPSPYADIQCGDCGGGDATCDAGMCVCPADTTLCGQVCADLVSTADHCGGCGLSCLGDEVCADGVCEQDPAGMVRLSAGAFTMGTSDSDRGWYMYDEYQHRVTLTHDLYMDVVEVTQADYEELMGENPSDHPDCADCPVENVGWGQAVAYANARSMRDGLEPCYDRQGVYLGGSPYACEGYRLPTEAEWEYAARAGTTTRWHNGSQESGVPSIAWFRDNTERPQPVATRSPNDWGLYDMSGNVSEWCADYKVFYEDIDTSRDPFVASLPIEADATRVHRGGSYGDSARALRSASRGNSDERRDSIGFRLVVNARD